VTAAEAEALLAARPFSSRWGYRVLELGDGECTLAVPYDPDWDRPGDILCGTVYMAAADCAMWMAVVTRTPVEVGAVSYQLDTTFLAPGRAEEISCRARVLRWGRRLAFGSAECRGADGRLLTHHTVTYALPAAAHA
jgi:uncharacterized protein (TIGR00369 family)